jgi:hypothetical protein
MISVSNEREVLKMKKVKESVQEKVLESFNNASILARGISNGGTYLSYEYDYVKASSIYRLQ